MKINPRIIVALVMLANLSLTACGAATPQTPQSPQGTPRVIAAETFLADIAQAVAGNRLKIEALIPVGVDPHAFTPTPADVRKVADSQVLIVNGAGVEAFLDKLLENAGGQRTVIVASAGLTMREPQIGEEAHAPTAGQTHEGDPHFWLDPSLVVKYVETIRDGLIGADPAGAANYTANAGAYIAKLKELDDWIAAQVKPIPAEKRLLVTNHESLGYFADRYGFKVVGTIVPGVSTGASPSAQQLTGLVDTIRRTGARAIFLETGANSQLAKQLAQETGIKVAPELYSHSITDAKGPAPTYLEMMRYNTRTIVEALK